MPAYAWRIRKTEKTNWGYDACFHADISASDSLADPIWSLNSGLWAHPTSPASKERLEALAAAFIEKLSASPPADILAGQSGNPRFFWMRDGGEDLSDEPTKLAIVFEDDYVLAGPGDGPFARSYGELILPLDAAQEPYTQKIRQEGFDSLYVETGFDALDAGLRERVVEALKRDRPDLAGQFEKISDSPSP